MRTLEPFVPIPEDVIPKMFSFASLRPGEMVIDLGSGDGRIVISAANLFGARAVGVDLRGNLVKESRKKAAAMGLAGRVSITRRNFRKVSLGKADVLVLYLSSYTLSLLAGKFRKELRHGTRIVTFDFPIPDWTAVAEELVVPTGWKKPHSMYLYVM